MATEVAVEDLRSARPRDPRAVGKVEQYMTRDPICFRRDTPLEDALRALIEHKISGAPVVEPYEGDSTGSGRLVGVISEEDLLWKEVDATDKTRACRENYHPPSPPSSRPPVSPLPTPSPPCPLALLPTCPFAQLPFCSLALLLTSPFHFQELETAFRAPYLWSMMTSDTSMLETYEDQALKVLSQTVGLSMSEQSISVTPDTPVKDAATIMLDAKIKRLPVVAPREGGRPGVTVVGVISRNDVLRHVLSVLTERGGTVGGEARGEGAREGGRGRVEAGAGGAGGKGGGGGKPGESEGVGGAGGVSGLGGITPQAEVGGTGGGGEARGEGKEGGKGGGERGAAAERGGEGGEKVQTGLVKGGA
ncbi:unnamed protein product [Closterium sp. NIES-65]|nr:unnamed protein product [Closterium sp. NIES-65]